MSNERAPASEVMRDSNAAGGTSAAALAVDSTRPNPFPSFPFASTSSKPARLTEQLATLDFSLTDAEVAAIDEAGKTQHYRHFVRLLALPPLLSPFCWFRFAPLTA